MNPDSITKVVDLNPKFTSNNNDTMVNNKKYTDDDDGETDKLLLRSWSNTDEQQYALSS